jgi:hypothetical protein
MTEEITQEVNIITTYEVEGTTLREIKTPEKVIPEVKSYDIESVKEELEKINSAIAQWEAKKAPLEAIIAKYDEIKPVEEPINE